MRPAAQSAQAEDTEWYNSALDWWLGVILVILPVVAVVTLVLAIVEGEGLWAAVIACLFIAALYRGVVMPVRYGLGRTHLTVRFGLVRQRIPYDRIRVVRPTRNPLSSPALSLNRLRVECGGFWQAVMISPTPRDAFLDGLASRAGLRREGDTLRRDG